MAIGSGNAVDLARRLGELRGGVFVLLDEAVGMPGDAGEVITRLQRAANEIGAAQAAVRPTVRCTKPGVPAPLSTPARTDLTGDAQIVLELAATALPQAGSREAEALRWLKVFRRHGQVGRALAALGVPETPLETAADPTGRDDRAEHTASAQKNVLETARRMADARSARRVGTVDLLAAVMMIYGGLFERALYLQGTTSPALLNMLPAEPGAVVAQPSTTAGYPAG